MIEIGARVAIVDDVTSSATIVAGIAEEAGLKPIVISEGDGIFSAADQLRFRIQTDGCQAVICDHRLSQRPFASFTGAELLSLLYRKRIPGLLLSTFAVIDADSSIRLHKAFIPSVLGRQDLDPNQVVEGLRRCDAELQGQVQPDRVPWRTLVRILGVATEGEIPLVEAILHTWKAETAVRFPLDAIEDAKIRETVSTSSDEELRLFAQVNVGCDSESELFFRSFEFAPEPNIDSLKP